MTRRDEIYGYICGYADAKHGPTPSIREIAGAFGLAYTTVYNHVLRLQVEGLIRVEDGKLIVVGSQWYSPEEV